MAYPILMLGETRVRVSQFGQGGAFYEVVFRCLPRR